MDLVLSIKEAHKEALRNGIQANTILINRDTKAFRLTKEFMCNGCYIPPMILGLDSYITDELPSEISFALLDSPNHSSDREKIRAELLAELRGLNLDELVRAVYGINVLDNRTVCE